jgi:hypothetical protein
MLLEVFPSPLAAAVALAVTSALAGCAGGVALTDAPDRSARAAESRQPAAATPERRDDDGARPAPAPDAKPVAEASDGPGDRGGADRVEDPAQSADGDGVVPELAAIVRSPGIDLEFNAGLPEPSQEQVVAPPAPWTPSRDAEAGAKPFIEDIWPDKAPASGGDRIVLRGKNLQAAQVVFGLAPAKILDASTDRLTVAAPAASAGEVAIVVTNRDGSYAIAGTPFHYYN